MSATLAYPLEAEKIISDLENNLDYRREFPVGVQKVLWLCNNPSNIWPLLASLSDEPETIDSQVLFKQNLRNIPLVLRHSETFIIRLVFDNFSDNQSFKALENYGIDISEIRKNASGGVLVLGSGKGPLKTLKNVNEVINVIMRLFIDEPEDMCQTIISIEAEGPFPHITDFELIIQPEIGQDNSDIVWVAITQDEISVIQKEIEKLINRQSTAGIIPIIIFDREITDKYENETQASEFLNNSIKDCEKNLENLSRRIVFPPIMLCRTWYHDEPEDTSYHYELFSLLWRTTNIAIFNSGVNNRLNSVTDFVLKKPVSVIELLRQKTNLEKLKTIPVIRLNPPDFSEFINLREKGIEKYSAEIITISEPEIKEEPEITEEPSKTEEIIAGEPIIEAPPVEVFDTFIESVHEFLNELVMKDFCKYEHKEIAGLARRLELEGNLWNREDIGQFTGKIDSIFDNIGNRLNEIESNLQSGLQNYKTRHASLIIPAKQYTPEEIEKVEFFWSEFIPLSFKKLKQTNLLGEIKKICANSREEFLDYISLTPWYSNEFNKSIKSNWPGPAKNINDLLDQSLIIWELKINEELVKLEEFRKKNFPDEPKIPTKIKITITGKPSIPVTLDIKIKKPGLLDILVSQQEKEEWHTNTVCVISNYVDEIIKKYQNDVSKWLGVIENDLNIKLGAIEKMGRDSLNNIISGLERSKQAVGETVTVKREIEIIEKNIDKLAENTESYKFAKQKWIEIKSGIDKDNP